MCVSLDHDLNFHSSSTFESPSQPRIPPVLPVSSLESLTSFLLYRQFGVPPSSACSVKNNLQIRPYDRYIPREASNSREEVAEEDEDSIELN